MILVESPLAIIMDPYNLFITKLSLTKTCLGIDVRTTIDFTFASHLRVKFEHWLSKQCKKGGGKISLCCEFNQVRNPSLPQSQLIWRREMQPRAPLLSGQPCTWNYFLERCGLSRVISLTFIGSCASFHYRCAAFLESKIYLEVYALDSLVRWPINTPCKFMLASASLEFCDQ